MKDSSDVNGWRNFPHSLHQDTVVRWHRIGFRFYWHWNSHRGRGGRPSVDPDVKQLIRTMSRDNVGWGAPRIHGELSMLGIDL